MEHIFAFPGNIDFAPMTLLTKAHFHIIHERLLCLLNVCETMFIIGESRTISHPNETERQAEQVPANLR